MEMNLGKKEGIVVVGEIQKREIMLGKEKKRSDVNIQRSEKQWHGDPGLRH